MMKELDPHSVYIPKDEVRAMNEPLQGNFEGIGIQFNILDDTILVLSTIPGGPSEKVGVRAGDRLLSVNGEPVAGTGITNNEVRKRLMGNKGTVVNVTIKRSGEKEPIEFAITRDKIPIFSLDAAYMVDKATGYIKLNRFSANTHDEFTTALKKLQDKGLKNLILDLGGNGGGYLNMAVQLADEFLDTGKLMVYTEGRNSPVSNHFATTAGGFESGRLVVIIDEGSASASEIVSGAIQDWDRGVIIGRRSYGKGLVQRQYPLTDSSAIRLTIAHYYTPSGRSIQKPYSDDFEDYYKEARNRIKTGTPTDSLTSGLPDSLKFKTRISGRTVYGGGGIHPDYFVPIDTSYYTPLYRQLVSKGILNRTSLSFTDSNRDRLKSLYPTFEAFNKQYIIEDEVLSLLWKEASKDQIEKDSAGYTRSEMHLQIRLKALIARDLFGTAAYYEVINQVDHPFTEACRIIGNKKEYNAILKGEPKKR
jgi:carboxyl-terminal processing protease